MKIKQGWVSPYRRGMRQVEIPTPDGPVKVMQPHVIFTVAKSRAERHNGFEVAVSVYELAKHKDKPRYLTARIEEALKSLAA